ncbi:hypothetical protein GPECTOR_88g469 [Gonium pectorale]|uniref:Uncharacterized protein n=1 Tax=Gonium pectorale TaxID=33097 RepID=A0A150G0X2_GONPE|nr:hypothetical protein GPECTOR_88g469 [Gonium pectorale]|eukprot:KXZ43526.1 hypothetical protein GPECTOR_88g469 [Gonium pectorale]
MTVTKKRSAVDEDVLECQLQCLPDLDIYYATDYLVPSNTFKAFQVPALRRKASSRVAKTMQRVFEVPVKDPLDPVT